MRTCPGCGSADNLPQARFCMSCGGPLDAAERPEQFRKTVTILFSDLVGSTTLGERLDPESLAALMTEYFDTMRGVIARHEGTVAKFMGDAVMAVFGIPRLHEDDALRAVRAAAEMRDALAGLNSRFAQRWGVAIATRTGLNTGVVAGSGTIPDQDFVAGDTANVAARLEQAAEAGEILLAETTYRLVRAHVDAVRVPPMQLRGKAGSTAVYRLVGVGASGGGASPGQRIRLVGRKNELDVLRWSVERAVEDRGRRIVTVLGDAGVGKSRLVAEFLEEIGAEATVLRGRCLPYGDGTTFWPLVEILQQAAGIGDDDSPEVALAKLEARLAPSPDAPVVAARLAQLAGLAPAAVASESPSFAVTRLLHGLARQGPLVVVLEDLQWAEPRLLSLVEDVAEAAIDGPMVVLCLARPEFAEAWPAWGVGAGGSRLELTPLNAAECDRMVTELLGEAGGLRGLRDRIAAAAAGNPLYAEQMVSMLVDDGVLVQTDAGLAGRSGADLATIPIPPGIHALLAGRLERLGRDERAVLGAAAVIGHIFYLDAIRSLADGISPEQVSATVLGLVRKDLVRPARSDLHGQEAFAFQHQLIRDVAYEGLSKSQRASLHERFADWMDGAVGERAIEQGEILGYHLEQAHRYLTELGPADDRVQAIGRRAADWLARAGWRSSALGDSGAGVALRRRALALMPHGAPGRAKVLAELGDALLWRGLFSEAAEALAEAVASADEADARPRRLARLTQLRLDFQVNPDADYAAIEREALAAAEELEASGDDFGAARAWRVVYWARWGMGRLDGMRPAAERGYEHDQRSRDPHYPQDDLIGVLASLVFGPTPCSAALEEGAAILEAVRGHSGAEAFALCFLGQLRGMLGQADVAREMIERGVAARVKLGDLPGAAMGRAEALGYFVEMVEGNWSAAERVLRQGYETLRAMEDRNYFAVTAGWLAHALIQLGRDAEAEPIVAEARGAAASSLVAAQVLWRGALGVILARRGELAEGERLGREAVALALATDRPDTQTDALMDLAEVLRVAGRPGDAAAFVEDALRRYEAKEVLPAAARARVMLGELRAAAGSV